MGNTLKSCLWGGKKVLILRNAIFASLSPDKEDCISLGLMTWVTIGLIVFVMISCVCCVAACRLRNKVSKSMGFCTSLLPRLWTGNLI